jgi:hypothetical protein
MAREVDIDYNIAFETIKLLRDQSIVEASKLVVEYEMCFKPLSVFLLILPLTHKLTHANQYL